MTALDRRTFLRRLGFGTVAAAAAAVGVFDVERLLWVPGEKTIVVPELVELDAFAVDDWVIAEGLRVLKRQLTVVKHFNRDYTSLAVGDTVHVPLPRMTRT